MVPNISRALAMTWQIAAMAQLIMSILATRLGMVNSISEMTFLKALPHQAIGSRLLFTSTKFPIPPILHLQLEGFFPGTPTSVRLSITATFAFILMTNFRQAFQLLVLLVASRTQLLLPHDLFLMLQPFLPVLPPNSRTRLV